MAEIPPHPMVDIDPDFEPLSRPRSCTWPLPRPEVFEPASSNTSSPAPSVKQEPGGNVEFISNLSLLEETDDYPEEKPLILCNDFQCQENCVHGQTQQQHPQQLQHPSPQLPHQQQVPPLSSPVGANSVAGAQRKSSSSRRNAWGNMSYADLITKAIESSPEKRLTLSQIYDWMVKSVPYFKDKGDSNSSAGWKVSVLSCGRIVEFFTCFFFFSFKRHSDTGFRNVIELVPLTHIGAFWIYGQFGEHGFRPRVRITVFALIGRHSLKNQVSPNELSEPDK